MKKIISFVILLIFIINSNAVIIGSLNALKIWGQNIFPVLFPMLMLSDLIISTGIINDLTKYIKINTNYLYILLISILAGTPTNAKSLLNLYENNNINKKDMNIIISSCLLFNPFFVIKFTNIKIYFIILIANMITILFNYKKLSTNIINVNNNYNLTNSISNNIDILLNILGTITVFMVLANIFKTPFTYLNIFLSNILEVTTGLNIINLTINNKTIKEIFYLFSLSFGGLSIFIQIKSILKDTFYNYKLYFFNRLLVFIISLIIYSSIEVCNISLLLSELLKYLFNFTTMISLFLFPNVFR